MNAIIPNVRDRKRTKLALDSILVGEAERLGIDLSGAEMVMLTQFASAVHVKELGEIVAFQSSVTRSQTRWIC